MCKQLRARTSSLALLASSACIARSSSTSSSTRPFTSPSSISRAPFWSCGQMRDKDSTGQTRSRRLGITTMRQECQ